MNNGNINNNEKLEAVSMFLKEIANYMRYEISEYEGTKTFHRHTFKEIFDNYILKLSSEQVANIHQDNNNFFIFDKYYGTTEEKSLIEFIKNEIDNLVNKKYTEIYLIRNERKLKIYNFSDGEAFEPDFLLFMNNKKGNNEIYYQIFIEPKGNQFKDAVGDFKNSGEG
ncbi:MAG: hypothetical protein QM532_03520 [Cyanobium sp. MAG06]|nr:hypothetical protein [Cyanobium sp. MAG06]